MKIKSIKFLVKNAKYTIALTGPTTYVLDKHCKKEVARFRDVKNAHRAAFCPGRDLLAVKSTDPWLAFYSMDDMCLIKKHRIAKPNNELQEGGFCFSPDGRLFFNIETQPTQVDQLVVYDSETLEEVRRFFAKEPLHLKIIEYDYKHQNYSILGYQERPIETVYLIIRFDGKKILTRNSLTQKEFEMLYKNKNSYRSPLPV